MKMKIIMKMKIKTNMDISQLIVLIKKVNTFL